MASLTPAETHLRAEHVIHTHKMLEKNRKEKLAREKRKEEKKNRKLSKITESDTELSAVLTLGKIARIYVSSCLVLANDQYITCALKPDTEVTIGDNVLLDQNNNITQILPRSNYYARRAITGNSKSQSQLIAANLDYVAIYLPCKNPDIDFDMIDKMLFACFSNNLKAILILNKEDLLDTQQKQQILSTLETYKENIYSIFFISALNATGTQELKEFLKDKTTLLTGISGAGKSTFTNLVCPEINLKTKEIDQKSGRGKHTTTYSTLIHLDNGGYIIDTPGIQTFDVYRGNKEEINYYLKEISHFAQDCKFADCSHLKEDTAVCGVKTAIQKGNLNSIVYTRYKRLMAICR